MACRELPAKTPTKCRREAYIDLQAGGQARKAERDEAAVAGLNVGHLACAAD